MTVSNRASIYVPITSITKADGGRTRIVTGVAASDRLDYDGERASYDWFKRELTDWFQVGNMRQDHRPGGVGKALSLEFDDTTRTATVTSKAVDSDTVLKLDEKILTGYSWGAKSVPGNPIRVRKDATGVPWVESGKIVEVSYVDHPANPDCFVSLVKSAGKAGLRRSKILGDLEAGDIPGGQDYDAILKALLADIAKRDVSAAERDRLGDQGHAIDTGQDHPSYPIANKTDLGHAIQAYGRAKPDDRAALRRHIISEAKRLGATDMIPDDWKTLEAVLTKAVCDCCDDCGPDCVGDCCDDCTMTKAAAGPAGLLSGITTLVAGEPDAEYRGFLGKLASAVEGWSRTPDAAIDVSTYATLATLAKAAGEPDLAKRRTFYSTANRAEVEQVLQQLHQALGVYMQGAVAPDADKDARDGSLTGQDAPAADDQPGGPGTAPGDGNPGDGNLAYDPAMVRDGDPAIRTPDGVRDGRAQGEGGTHTWPPAGDAPGPGPGDQGKGEAPGGKGREPDPQQAQQQPTKASKAERQVARLERRVEELTKALGAQQPGHPVAVNLTTAGQQPPAPKGGSKALRRDIAELTEAVRKTLERQPAPAVLDTHVPDESIARLEKRLRKAAARAQDDGALRAEVAKATAAVQAVAARPADSPQQITAMRLELARALDKLERRMTKRLATQPAPPPDLSPLGAQIEELRKAIGAQQAAIQAARPDAPPVIDNSLLLADLTRAAYDQTRKDLTEATMRLAEQVKRVERKLRKAAAADSQRLDKVAEGMNALGRLPHPGGPHVARPSEKTFPVNDTVERHLSPDLEKRAALLMKMSESSDRQVAEDAREMLRALTADLRG